MTNTSSVISCLSDLQRVVGFRDSADAAPLAELYRAGDYSKLCRAIAEQMKIFNEIKLERATANTPFKTRALSPTDASGRGTQGIVAQVEIPENLPIYGTKAFSAHVIRITAGAALGKVPAETAVAIIAHELSHILLHSLRQRDRDSEQATDLVPIALGFADIVRSGRIVKKRTVSGNVTTTHTTTYGYLSEEEFESAAAIVSTAVAKWRADTAVLAGLLGDCRRVSEKAKGEIESGRCLLLALDKSRRKGHISDSARIVAMHALGYFDDRKDSVDSVVRSWFDGIPKLLDAVNYTTEVSAGIEAAIESGRHGLIALSHLRRNARSDLRVLNRSRSLLPRAIGWVRYGWL